MDKHKQETTSKNKANQTFIIRNKLTKQLWVASSGKSSWKKPNHAKCAFANSTFSVRKDPLLQEFVSELGKYESLKFNDQDVYELIELVPEDIKAGDISEERIQLRKDLVDTLYGKDYTIMLDSGKEISVDDIFKIEG